MKLYIQIDKDTNKVISYSSNKLNDDDLEFEEEDLDEEFLAVPVFYIYNKEQNIFVHNETIEKELREDHASSLSDTQRLAQGQSQNDLDIMILKKQIEQLTETINALKEVNK